MSISIPKNVVDRLIKRLDCRLSAIRHELDTADAILLMRKKDDYSPFIVDVFSAERTVISRSNNPRLFLNQYINVFIEAHEFKHFSAIFFENSILEYNICKQEMFGKCVQIDALDLMKTTDYWYVDNEKTYPDQDKNYVRNIEDSLNSLLTNRKANSGLERIISQNCNFNNFMLEMLNGESGDNFLKTINKYFNYKTNISELDYKGELQ